MQEIISREVVVGMLEGEKKEEELKGGRLRKEKVKSQN